MTRADTAIRLPLAVACSIAVGVLVTAQTGDLAGAAVAQTAKTETSAPSSDGRKAVIDGIKAYESGRMDKAVPALTKAIEAGGLSPQDLAKALYYRGLAYQRSEQTAKAIADLTNAVWMDGGLNASEQQNALAVRGKAYAAVGLPDPGPPTQRVAAAAPAGTPAAGGNVTTVTSSSNPLSGVGNFFSNLFTSGSSAGASSSGPATTASTAKPAAAAPSPAAAPVAKPPASVSGWSSETQVAAVAPAARPAAAPAPQTQPAAGPSGKYLLQVAAVRSRGDAERLVAQLQSQHSSTLGPRTPTISETVFGNMGTFYQVNVGPFAKSAETQAVCKTLKADGFDCLVVER